MPKKYYKLSFSLVFCLKKQRLCNCSKTRWAKAKLLREAFVLQTSASVWTSKGFPRVRGLWTNSYISSKTVTQSNSIFLSFNRDGAEANQSGWELQPFWKRYEKPLVFHISPTATQSHTDIPSLDTHSLKEKKRKRSANHWRGSIKLVYVYTYIKEKSNHRLLNTARRIKHLTSVFKEKEIQK